jgi:hypothetical protein
MKVYTSIKMQWDGTAYQRVSEQSYEYTGEVAQCCGATSAQNQIQNQQMSLSNEATSQAQSIFGSDSAAYNQLLNTFSPTVQAGPGQNGFSAQETANLDSQAITANGQAAKNAKQAAGEQQAAAGGGNTVLPSGTTAATDANIDTAIAGNTANELSGITQAGYAQGAKNYEEAAQGLEAAPGVFNGRNRRGHGGRIGGESDRLWDSTREHLMGVRSYRRTWRNRGRSSGRSNGSRHWLVNRKSDWRRR